MEGATNAVTQENRRQDVYESFQNNAAPTRPINPAMPSALIDEHLAAELLFAVVLGLGEVDALLLGAPADAGAGEEAFADGLGEAAAGAAELGAAATGVDAALRGDVNDDVESNKI